MLPSAEINKAGDICLFHYGLNIAGVEDIGYPKQELYIISADEPKEGDAVLCITHNGNHGKVVLKITSEFFKTDHKVNGWVKIIASTDERLGLPTIRKDWLRCIYVPHKGIVESVDIEMEGREPHLLHLDNNGSVIIVSETPLCSWVEDQEKVNDTPTSLNAIAYTGSVEQKEGIKYGRYLVVRKDGKKHLETFNGTGWAYNNNAIRWFYLPQID